MSFKSIYFDPVPRRIFLQKSLKVGLALAATPTLMSGLLANSSACHFNQRTCSFALLPKYFF